MSPDDLVLDRRVELLLDDLAGRGSVLVAFSGGADSAFLLAAAVRVIVVMIVVPVIVMAMVMVLMAAGKTPAQIAQTMHLSVKTVANYRARVLAKTGWRNNIELTKYCVQHGLTTSD